MEQLEASSSSKVTVEYSDPSGVFPLISHDLRQRLPLRNLHWNSASRPLRSIDSLHIELVRDDRPTSQRKSSAQSTEDAVHSKVNTSRERRHQIPGLRQTPYLKVYLLRCEDTDTYKTTSRKLLREWVKEHTPPSQNSSSFNKAENHDAFEWLIVHVTSPISDQGKGSQNSDGAKGDSHTERTPSASRWSNRSSSSVIEKIRSDFNSTSKTGIDRVAQVYVSEIQPLNTSSDKQRQDDSQGFKDLISKLKFLILTSFDQRVSQYEEDIREKDSQRTLPGWNFNTFFVLKEGLARGFESVGLIEDALTSYHELSVTLNVTVAEHPWKSSDDHASPFRDFTDDLSGIFKQAINAIGDDVVGPDDIRVSQDLGALILDTSRKPYREMILENNITAFDFLCYVFARQISLQLRLANAILLNQEYPANGEPSKRHRNSISRELEEEPEIENLLILADICRQTIEFITFICPIIRDDLRASLNIPAQNPREQRVSDEIDLYSIIENIVASWTYSACQCILEKTSTQSLSTRMQPLLRQFKAHGSYDTVQSQDEKGVKPVVGTNLPPRTSSLITQAPHPGMPSSPEKFPSLTSLDAVRLLPPTSSQTGFQELAAERADVYGMARRCLGSLGLRNSGWKGGWSDLALVQSTEDRLDEVSLEDDHSDRPEVSTETQRSPGSHMAGIRNRALLSALMSKTTFYKTYEDLTASSLALFVLGDRPKSAEALTADIAAIRLYNYLNCRLEHSLIESCSHLRDYTVAASYFHQLAPFYSKDGWGHLEMSMLDMYAQCLKLIGRDDDYVRIGLKMIAKLADMDRMASGDQLTGKAMSFSLTDLVSASKLLVQPILVPIESYFGSIALDPYPRPYDDHDGFQLQLRVRNLTFVAIEAHHIQIKIVSVQDYQHSELFLTASDIHCLQPGTTNILVGTNNMIPAQYIMEKLSIRSENIIFALDFPSLRNDTISPRSTVSVSSEALENISQSQILVWPQVRAFNVRLFLNSKIHLERPRSIDIEISTGWNYISRGKLSLRAGSAGLRLHTADTVLVDGNTTVIEQSQPGNIVFGQVLADSGVLFRVPYGVENDPKEITVKVEVSFTTTHGEFTYGSCHTIPILLPLGVNVQDVFHQDALFSKFTISTATSVPLRISKCHLQSSEYFDVASPPLTDKKLDVFVRQPLSFVSKVCQKLKKDSNGKVDLKAQRKLLLEIEYHCLDQEINDVVEQSLAKSLAGANLQELSRLLVPAVLTRLRSSLSIQELEMARMLDEIDIGAALESVWTVLSASVQPGLRIRFANWVKEWNKKKISISSGPESPKLQYLTVPVEIPQISVVHTVYLRLQQDNYRASGKMGAFAVGQAIPAELVIKHTRGWSNQTGAESKDEQLEFYYEVHTHPDTWLVGGQRKAHFSAREMIKENESLSFPLLLLPQRVGLLLYPSVDVSLLHRRDKASIEDQGASSKTIPVCETDYRSQCDTLLVIANLRSTTVSLDPGSSGSGSWLVESIPGRCT